MSRTRAFAAVLSLSLALVAATAEATTLRKAMEKVADVLAAEIRHGDIGGKSPSVFVELPDGPPADGATTRVKKELVDALKAKDVKVGNRLTADLMVAMAYSRTRGSSRYSLKVRVKDRSNRSLGVLNGKFTFDNAEVEFVDGTAAKGDENVELTIDDPKERATLEGASFDATIDDEGEPTKATVLNVTEKLNAKPSVFVTPGAKRGVDSVVGARKESPFRIEILVRPKSDDSAVPPRGGNEYTPRAVEVVDGMALCEFNTEEAYAVRVINDANHAVAIDLSIDGINVWAVSGVPAWRERGLFLLAARSSSVVRGWHVGTNENPALYREFGVVGLPEALAAELGSKDGSPIGQVSAQFFAAWSDGEEPPFVEVVGSPATAAGEMLMATSGNPRLAAKNGIRLRSGASRADAVRKRYPVLPDPREVDPRDRLLPKLRNHGEVDFALAEFAQKDSAKPLPGSPVDLAGELVPLWIGFRLAELGFDVDLEFDETARRAFGEFTRSLRSPSLKMSGRTTMSVERVLEPAGATVRAHLDVEVDVTARGSEMPDYERRWKSPFRSEKRGSVGDVTKLRETAMREVLDRMVEDLFDETFDARVLAARRGAAPAERSTPAEGAPHSLGLSPGSRSTRVRFGPSLLATVTIRYTRPEPDDLP